MIGRVYFLVGLESEMAWWTVYHNYDLIVGLAPREKCLQHKAIESGY